jgi:hypothetical protein
MRVDLLVKGKEENGQCGNRADCLQGRGALPERHVIDALVETGGVKVCAELLCKKIADVVALCSMAVAHAKHG